MTQTDFLCLTPLMIITAAPVVIMIVISILRNYDVVYGFSIFALLLAFISLFLIFPALPHSVKPLIIIDIYSLFFLGITILAALFVALLSYDYIKKHEGVREEYYIILFTTTLGASLLAVADHFIMFFLGLETLSISLYILIAFRKSNPGSIEAGMKYLILASVASAFLLFGMALIYVVSGTMQFSGIAAEITNKGTGSPMLLSGFGLMLVGIGFKLALVPFHMWTPDIYQGAPAPVAAYIATVSKGSVMAVLIRFFFNLRGFENHVIFVAVSVLAVLSMFIGNLLAIRQQNIKRLLAYSSIANMGYLIIILLTGSSDGIRAAIFYLLSYIITTIGAFGIITLLSTREHDIEMIDDMKGLFWKRPWVAIVFTITFLSLAGIPLTAGFMAKFYVIFEGYRTGLLFLVFAMVISSVIGLYYYLRVITSLFSASDDKVLPAINITGHLTIALIAILILLLGIYPGLFLDILNQFVAL